MINVLNKQLTEMTGETSYTTETLGNYPLYALEIYGKSTQGYASCGGTPLGKNLLSLATSTATFNGVTFTNNGDGTYTLNGTATGGTATFQFNIISSLPNLIGKDVIINGCPPGGSNTTYALQSFVEGFANHKFDWGSGVEVANWEENRTILRITVASGVTVDNLTFKPMIRLASELDDSFEQYYSNPNPECPVDIVSIGDNGAVEVTIDNENGIELSATITSGLPLCSVGDVRDELIYNADGTGKIIKRTENVTFDGSQTISSTTISNKQLFVYRAEKRSANKTLLCNCFIGNNLLFSQNNSCGIDGYTVYFRADGFNTADDFKAFAVSNSLKIVYQLETPYEIELSAEEMALLQQLQTFEGVTNLYNNGNGEMYIRAMTADFEYGHEVGFFDSKI